MPREQGQGREHTHSGAGIPRTRVSHRHVQEPAPGIKIGGSAVLLCLWLCPYQIECPFDGSIIKDFSSRLGGVRRHDDLLIALYVLEQQMLQGELPSSNINLHSWQLPQLNNDNSLEINDPTFGGLMDDNNRNNSELLEQEDTDRIKQRDQQIQKLMEMEQERSGGKKRRGSNDSGGRVDPTIQMQVMPDEEVYYHPPVMHGAVPELDSNGSRLALSQFKTSPTHNNCGSRKQYQMRLQQEQVMLIECFICKNSFDYVNRRPYLLPCSHTACKVCLQEFINSKTELE